MTEDRDTVRSIERVGDRLLVVHRATGEGARRLEIEAGNLRFIQHPNVIELIDVSRCDDEVTLTTAFVGHNHLFSARSLSAQLAVDYSRALMSIVAELHGCGVAHRNLRGESVICSRGNKLVVSSWDRATRFATEPHKLTDTTSLGKLVGELAHRARVESRADQHRVQRLAEAAGRLERARHSNELVQVLNSLSEPNAAPKSLASRQPRPSLARTTAGAARHAHPAVRNGLACMMGLACSATALVWLATRPQLAYQFWDEPTLDWTRLVGSMALIGAAAAAMYATAVCTIGCVAAIARPDVADLLQRFLPAWFRVFLASSVALSVVGPKLIPAADQPQVAASLTDPTSPTTTAPLTTTSNLAQTMAPAPTTTLLAPVTTLGEAPRAVAPVQPQDAATGPNSSSHASRQTDLPGDWIVRPGDHFWGIAEQVLVARGGRVTNDQIAKYWRLLIAANRDRLVDRTNPDLIFAGQVFMLPPLR